jgi:hypothetical protein
MNPSEQLLQVKLSHESSLSRPDLSQLQLQARKLMAYFKALASLEALRLSAGRPHLNRLLVGDFIARAGQLLHQIEAEGAKPQCC